VPAVTFEAAANSAYKPVFSITDDLRQLGRDNVRLRTLAAGWRLVFVGAGYAPCCAARLGQWLAQTRAAIGPEQSADFAWIKPQLLARPAQLSAV
jgi:hypothetical protein